MKKLVLLSGPAAIGKSHFAKRYIGSHPDERVTIVSSDEVRKRLCGSYRNFPPHKDMTTIYAAIIKEADDALAKDENATVIIDSTMLTDERRIFFLDGVKGYEEATIYMLKLHDYNECLARNKDRDPEKFVPEEVILDMIKHYSEPGPLVRSKVHAVIEQYLDI